MFKSFNIYIITLHAGLLLPSELMLCVALKFLKRKFSPVDISRLSKLHYLDEIGLKEIAPTLALLGTGALLSGLVLMVECPLF
jgi:hypothetical protein